MCKSVALLSISRNHTIVTTQPIKNVKCSFMGYFPDGIAVVFESLQLCLHSSLPGVFFGVFLVFTLFMVSNGGLRVCVSVAFSSEHVSEPSPSPSNKNSFHAIWMSLDN